MYNHAAFWKEVVGFLLCLLAAFNWTGLVCPLSSWLVLFSDAFYSPGGFHGQTCITSSVRSCKVATSQVPGTAGSAGSVCKNSSAHSWWELSYMPKALEHVQSMFSLREREDHMLSSGGPTCSKVLSSCGGINLAMIYREQTLAERVCELVYCSFTFASPINW